MAVRTKKVHPALKHAGYSAATILPGEDPVAFKKLHRHLIAELSPNGPLEENTVENLTRLLWRKQHLDIFRKASLANNHLTRVQEKICDDRNRIINPEHYPTDTTDFDEADERARKELGGICELVDMGDAATIDGLLAELNLEERLDGMIDRCLKRLLFLKGIKSLPTPSAPAPSMQLPAPLKTFQAG